MMQWSQLDFVETISIVLFAGGIWVIYLFLTLRRSPVPEAIFRSSVLAIALFCLCLIIYKPQYNTNKLAGKALLLTQPVNTIPDSMPVFALPHLKKSAGVQLIPDLAFMERNYPQLAEVYIAGYGLEPEQARELHRLKVHFLEKQPPAGFYWLSYTRQVREGQDMIVSGTYINRSADTAKLLLSTVEGLQDSILLTAGENRFSLQAHTQIPGKYRATLQLVRGGSTRTELLPYVVEARQSLNILMLQGFPSFEMNYLKDWLGGGKHQIQVRARISRDNYSAQSINIAQKGEIKRILSEENLKTNDLLICDAESLRQFSTLEKKRLQQAVEEGLGLLVLADEEWLNKPEVIGHTFTLTQSRRLSFMPQQTAQAAQGKTMAAKLPVAFAEKPLLVPVAYSREEEMMTAYIPDGEGRVGALLATATFPWILQGEANTYSYFWTDIIQTLSRRQAAGEFRLVEFPFILKDHPSIFTVTDTMLIPATIHYDSGLRQQSMPAGGLPQTVETMYSFLPAEEGWIQITYGEDTASNHQAYVLPAIAWMDLQQANWWRQNQKGNSVIDSGNAYTFSAQEEVPALWFFVPFVASLAILWWREKEEGP